MSERSVRVNDPPAGVTDTGFGMTFAFERSVGVDAFGRSAGVEEQATVANIVAEVIMATRVFSVFNGRLFIDYTIHLCNSAGNPVG
jgi:hypothetical protein